MKLSRSIPRTAEARVRWLLKFAMRPLPPLSKSSAGARSAAAAGLAALAGYPPSPLMPSALLDETHARLRHTVELLANGRPCGVWLPEAVWMLIPPPRRPKGARASAPLERTWDAAAQGWQHLPTALILGMADDLNVLGADRLRSCPLERGGQRCGVIFLAHRRQTYCSVPHAQAAAWQSYQLSEAKREFEQAQKERR
jgi:hypothetical protein